jgi:L,D-peptidoglycan transpeptidase YkuD (ErfK/YbiS/YcfS/YnhG family)
MRRCTSEKRMALVPLGGWILPILLSATVMAFNPARAGMSSGICDQPLRESRQCLVVITSEWKATSGILTVFERRNGEKGWRQKEQNIPVVVGKSGLAWGRGVADVGQFAGPVKVEGDGAAPAGVFRLSSAFGYAPRNRVGRVGLQYRPLTRETEGIDDPTSRYYNQLVERSNVSNPDWHSSEQMWRRDSLYRWGIVVDHNTRPVIPRRGSCIFLHVWRGAKSSTVGCTTMPEQNIKQLVDWLDPKANPILVQLPRAEFERLKGQWRLPASREKRVGVWACGRIGERRVERWRGEVCA